MDGSILLLVCVSAGLACWWATKFKDLFVVTEQAPATHKEESPPHYGFKSEETRVFLIGENKFFLFETNEGGYIAVTDKEGDTIDEMWSDDYHKSLRWIRNACHRHIEIQEMKL